MAFARCTRLVAHYDDGTTHDYNSNSVIVAPIDASDTQDVVALRYVLAAMQGLTAAQRKRVLFFAASQAEEIERKL